MLILSYTPSSFNPAQNAGRIPTQQTPGHPLSMEEIAWGVDASLQLPGITGPLFDSSQLGEAHILQRGMAMEGDAFTAALGETKGG